MKDDPNCPACFDQNMKEPERMISMLNIRLWAMGAYMAGDLNGWRLSEIAYLTGLKGTDHTNFMTFCYINNLNKPKPARRNFWQWLFP